MASGYSNYLRNKLLDHAFRGVNYPSPSLWLALMATAPTNAGGGVEASYAGYARVFSTTWTGNAVAGDGSTYSPAHTFAQAFGTGGTINAIAVYDASTVGNLLVWAVLDYPLDLTISNNDVPRILASKFVIRMDN